MTWRNVLRRESNVSRIEAMGVIINNRNMKCTGSGGGRVLDLEDNAGDNEAEEAMVVNLKEDDLTDDEEERIEKREQCK